MVLTRKHLHKINNYQPGKPIGEVKRELGLSKVIKLASNELPFSPSKYVRQAIKKELACLNRYPDAGCFYLREAIAKKFDIAQEKIIFGNGSDELIVLALRALVDSGEEVIVGQPSFLIYGIQARAMNLKVVTSRLDNFRYNLEDIKSKITKKTKLIFIANPDNPHGTYLMKNEVEDFVSGLPKQVVVFFDEAYFEFAPGDFPDSLNLLKKGASIIITRTFSKAYGLAGLRIGYGFASQEIIQAMEKVKEPFNVNSLAQSAALAALHNPSELKKLVSYINQEKRILYRELDSLPVSYVRSAANFVLIRLNKDSSFVCSELLKQGVIVRDMKIWGMDNFIRVTLGKRSENLKFIRALKKLVIRKEQA